MKAVTTATCLLSVLLFASAGCTLRHHGDSSVGQRFGSDYFGAGGSVNLTENVDGDAFLAGGDIATASEVRGNLIAAGGDVTIGGNVREDLYAGGGDVHVDAIVHGKIRVAGGQVTVGPATIISGSTALAGGQIRFEGDALDGLTVSGGSVAIDGHVRGDAEIEAEDIEIGPQANIEGKLVVHSSQQPVVPPGATIRDGIEFHAAKVGVHVHDDGDWHDAHAATHGFGSVVMLISVFVIGTLFTLAFPTYSARAADWIGREPLRSLGLGFVVAVCLPVLALLLVLTIIGIPLALIVVFLYLLLLFLGWITAALFVSRKGLDLLRSGRPETTGIRLIALLLAIVALWAIGHVPLVGGWIKFAALLLGIGALVWQGWPRRTSSMPRGAT